MKDGDKPKQQLIHGLEKMRWRVAELERSAGERKQRGEEPKKRD
jgi:hypothetical protein